MELAAGAMRTVECALHAGERVRWVIGVASYNILIDARFRERKGGGVNQRILFDRKRLGDEYQQDQSWACGMFTAEAAGTLDLNLDNTCAPSQPMPGRLPPVEFASDLLSLWLPGQTQMAGK